MANFNKILLAGNLTRDPQLSYLPSQTAVVEFGLAVNRTWTGKDGQKKEETCFIDCRAFAKQAETINKYLKKGSPVLIEGRLKFDSWTGQDGSKRSKHSVVVETFQFLGSGSGQSGGGHGQVGGASSDTSVDDSGPGVSDDDIPF
jgi:single-strand DNA-binding protein